MKALLFFFLLVPALTLQAQKMAPRQLDVLWIIDTYNGGDNNFVGVPWGLLDDLYHGKIKAYDNNWHTLTIQNIEQGVPLKMRKSIFTMEECDILAANGVF